MDAPRAPSGSPVAVGTAGWKARILSGVFTVLLCGGDPVGFQRKKKSRASCKEHWVRVAAGGGGTSKAAERGTGGERRRRQLTSRGHRVRSPRGCLAAQALFCVCGMGALCVRSCHDSRLVAVQRLGRQNAAQTVSARLQRLYCPTVSRSAAPAAALPPAR